MKQSKLKEAPTVPKPPAPPPELKLVKHEFTSPERDELGGRLAQSISQLRGVEAELEQMKSAYKARVSECEARIEKLHVDRLNGFEMREKLCRVEFDVPNRKKSFWPVDAPDAEAPALVERLTEADLQTQLPIITGDQGQIVVIPDDGEGYGLLRLWQVKKNGRDLWVATAHFVIGDTELDEIPIGLAPFGDKIGAVTDALKRVREWLIEKFDAATAAGFEPSFRLALVKVKDAS